jgi:hypothetical protein
MTDKNNHISEPSFTSFFKRPEKPSKIKSGQLWTVFANDKSVFSENSEDAGTVVFIHEVGEDSAFVVPVHPFKYRRPKTDIVLKKDIHFNGLSSNELVASIHLALSISTKAFDCGIYLGEFMEQGIIETKAALKNFENILFHLAMAQKKDSRDELMTDEESRNTVLAGIYDLIPVDGNLDDLIEFNNQIKDILEPWHILAMAEMFAEEEEKVAAIAESKPIYNFFQKVASKIKITINDVIQPDFFPAAAGEAEKADCTIPFEIVSDDGKHAVDIVFEWNNSEKVTEISLEGEYAEKLYKNNAELSIVFENGDQVSHRFDFEENFLFRLPLKNIPICGITISL